MSGYCVAIRQEDGYRCNKPTERGSSFCGAHAHETAPPARDDVLASAETAGWRVEVRRDGNFYASTATDLAGVHGGFHGVPYETPAEALSSAVNHVMVQSGSAVTAGALKGMCEVRLSKRTTKGEGR